MRVEDVMSTDVVTVLPQTPLKQVGRQLVERGISGAPVVTEAGEVVGVISEADLLVKEREALQPRGRFASLRRGDRHEQQKVDARVAADAMTTPAITVPPYRSVGAAAQEMLERGINRLPVIKHGRLVGIVTRADLVRAFARSDAEVAKDVRALLELFLALDDDLSTVTVAIDGGEVTLAGRVRRRVSAEALPRWAAKVPGVVGVSSEVTWAEDDSKRPRAARDHVQFPV
jgi:CBS domain-containing protein